MTESSPSHRPSADAATVTTVLVNYNQTDLTVACLQSLRQLTHPSRVVVVDNGSRPEQVERLRAQLPPDDLLVLPDNVGFTAANNAGMRFACRDTLPDFIWMLNNDTVAHPHALGALVEQAQQQPRCGAVASVLFDMGTDHVQAFGGGHVSLWNGRSVMVTRPVPEHELDFLSGTSLLIDMRAAEQTGLLDERYFMYWEDVDFCFRLRRAGWTLAVAPDSKVWHVGAASTGVNTRARKSETFERVFSQSTVRFYLRHAPLPAVPLARGLGWYLIKRVLRGHWPQARAIVQGSLSGLRHPQGMTKRMTQKH